MARHRVEQWQALAWKKLGILPEGFKRSSPAAEEKAIQYYLSQHPTADPDEVRRKIQALSKQDEVPTRYESPVFYNQLLRHALEIGTAASACGQSTPHKLLLGTIPSGNLNASAVKFASTGEFLILFEVGLFGFANLLSKVLTDVLMDESFQDHARINLDRPLAIQEEHCDHFAGALAAYVGMGHPMYATPYYPSPRSVVIHDMLLTATELFIVGHELTHVIAGHLDKIRSIDSAVPEGFAPESVMSWRDEFDADALGLELSLKACETRGIDLKLAFTGAALFFDYATVIEWTRAVLDCGESWQQVIESKLRELQEQLENGNLAEIVVGSHPQAQTRQLRLREVLKALVPADQHEAALSVTDRANEAVFELFNRCVPRLLAMHQQGIRPART